MLARRKDLPPVWDPGQGIRATVIGAAQFSVQVSGNTILITKPDDLPMQNLPVIACAFDMAADGRSRRGHRRGAQGARPRPTSRKARRRSPSPSPGTAIPRTRGCTRSRSGIAAALPNTIAAGMPVVLLIDGDVGKSLGRIIRNEVAPGAHVIALDGVQLKQFDYVDIGRVIELTNAVPVIIKSLLFK